MADGVIFQVYAELLLTMAGFALPILTIALSFFPEGVKILTEKYENERHQAENNLAEEFKKKAEGGVDLESLGRNIASLKKAKRHASKRLLYLSPRIIVVRSISALGGSLVIFLMALV